MTLLITSSTQPKGQRALRESNAEVLLALLEGSRGQVGTRPQSLPANLAHLWQSLKVTALSPPQFFSFTSSLTSLLTASAIYPVNSTRSYQIFNPWMRTPKIR
ncbi:hypothetical protein GE061_013960 [Apolygus lucorum]|uniref:Uncharacterized protein n=1 Tax=Apolygus lucorum TaxID=248454 RepID=A0A8S9XQI4_APOLU|nr:hypothetical protein GE061_013960 [Apolygus lucorum]